jgi:hypothetical protein
VVVGGLVTGGVSLWREWFITNSERETRVSLQERERRDRRDTFQRETLLAVQEAVEDARQAVFREYDRKLAHWKQDRPHWPRRAPGDPLPKDWSDADARITKLWARVFDPDLTSLVAYFQQAAGLVLTVQTQDRAFDELNNVTRLAHEVNSRTGELLHELF